MSVVAVVGAQWGDEGKGKIVDLLAEQASVVARYQGGNNAGHTVINPLGEFRLHLVPAGIFDPRVTCVIGNGVVIDPQALLDEIDLLASSGVSLDNLCISERAHVIMPYHILLDRLEEQARGQKSIGTTGRGIGPAYADKVARTGIRMGDLVDGSVLREKLAFILEQKNRLLTKLYDAEPLSFQAVYEQYSVYGARLAKHIEDTTSIVQAAVAEGRNVLLEGAQGTLLDLDFGTYPYVTSSSPTVGAACSGLGLAPTQIDRALGVLKAYQTRVGGGPFPTEMTDEIGEMIRERGHEYGTLTGRPRRIGWFDAVLARHAARINGFQSIAITRLDILDTLPALKICTKYRCDGVEREIPPVDLSKCAPIYEEHPGWQCATSDIRRFEDLPRAAQDYLNRIVELLGVRLDIVSVGSSREQSIMKEKTLALSAVL
ncbi:MAG: adenylosuccinate synthase [Dehalococcoidales bacterium]|nr:adenylosuccinate synthase [Dehalococcoidales bacterium]